MNQVIAFALRQRLLIVVLLFAVMAAGLVSFIKLNIEAYPDPVPPLVDIVTQSPGQSAEEMERYITIPIEVAMAGIPNVKTIRPITRRSNSSSTAWPRCRACRTARSPRFRR
jgi:cobalt-zinc-cadmium resistance protein CzcA